MAQAGNNTTRKKTTRKTRKKASRGARARASPAEGSPVRNGATAGATPEEPEAETTASGPEQGTLTGADGSAFLQQLMSVESFRSKVIARLVRKLM